MRSLRPVQAASLRSLFLIGFSNVDPITWLQSEIAINPNAHIVITPSSLNFGDVVVAAPAVATPEPEAWILIIIVLVIGSILGWKMGDRP